MTGETGTGTQHPNTPVPVRQLPAHGMCARTCHTDTGTHTTHVHITRVCTRAMPAQAHTTHTQMRAPRTCVHYNAVCTHGTHVHTTHTHTMHACACATPAQYTRHTCTCHTHVHTCHACTGTHHTRVCTHHTCALCTRTGTHITHTSHHNAVCARSIHAHTAQVCTPHAHHTHAHTHHTHTVSLSGPFSRPAPRLLDSVHPLVSTSPVGREGGDSHPGGLWLLQGSGQRDRSRCQGLGAGWVPRTVGVVAGRGRL